MVVVVMMMVLLAWRGKRAFGESASDVRSGEGGPVLDAPRDWPTFPSPVLRGKSEACWVCTFSSCTCEVSDDGRYRRRRRARACEEQASAFTACVRAAAGVHAT